MSVQTRRYRLSALAEPLADTLRASPALPAALAVMAVFVALGASEGGFRPTAWYAAALFVLGLLVATLLALGAPRAVPRPVLVALGLFAAYTAWTYVSIAWAGREGAAWDGANRTAVYLMVFALFALWPFDARGIRIVLGTLGLGIAGVGLVELLRVDAASNPAAFLIDVRLAEPVGYINANVALWTIGVLACLALAIDRDAPAALRGVAYGGAGLLASLGLLGQSRGWLLAVPLALAVWLALGPRRVRLLVAAGVVAGATFAISDPLLAVHDDYSPNRLDALVADGTRAALWMAAALVVAGLVAAILDRRVDAAGRGARATGRVVAALAVVAALGGGAVAISASDESPFTKASDAWDDFKTGGEGPQAGGSRFSGGGTNRYEFWTVAWDEFKERPLRGLGVENFQEEYLRRGRSGEQPRYAHSLELGVLSQTGVVGALLLAAALGAALLAALRGRPRELAARAATGAALALFAYWLLHASVDWFWEFPALTGPALAALGMVAGARTAPAPAAAPRRLPRALAAAGAAAALVLAASFALPWIAELEIDRANDRWRSGADAAIERLDRAADLNPLSVRPQLTAGTIALRVGDVRRAEAQFEAALEREPDEAYALLELGLIAAERGDERRALRLLRQARAARPTDDLTREVVASVRAGKRVDLNEVNRRILERARSRGAAAR